MNQESTPNPEELFSTLQNECMRLIPDNEKTWFEQKLTSSLTPSSFFMNFGLIGRKIPRTVINVSALALEKLLAINPDFQPSQFSLDELCRLTLLLKVNQKEWISTLIGSSDRRELIAIYKSVQYLPLAKDLVFEMTDGLRTNMVDVFDAIALQNAFPLKYFTQNAWNQMVLKAIFMERPVYLIPGLDERKNQALAETLQDFVKERWSAGRKVHPELWRLFEGFESEPLIMDLIHLTKTGLETEKKAACKVLFNSRLPEAVKWAEENEQSQITESWEEIGRTFQQQKP